MPVYVLMSRTKLTQTVVLIYKIILLYNYKELCEIW